MKKYTYIITLLLIIPALLVLFNGSAKVDAATLMAAPMAQTFSPAPTQEDMPEVTLAIDIEEAEIKEVIMEESILDVNAAREQLQEITGTELKLVGEEEGLDGYVFEDDTSRYTVSKKDGYLLLYVNDHAKKTGSSIDTKKAKKLANEIIEKYRPSFLEYDIKYDIDRGGNRDFYIYMYQLSPLKRETGNLVNIDMLRDGTIRSIRINDDEDPTIADSDYTIEKEQAIELAYTAAKKEMEELKKVAPNLEVYLDETKGHKVTAKLIVRDGIQLWDIGIDNVGNNRYDEKDPPKHVPMNMSVQIDATTGETIVVGYH